MSKIDRIMVLFILSCIFLFPALTHADKDKKMENSCVTCHSKLTGKSFVGVKSHDWKGSVHQKHGVTCDKCHGGNPAVANKKKAHKGVLGSSNRQSRVYYKNIPSTCGKCHGAEYYKFTQSYHFKKLEATGRGPDCVTCHGSMVTNILTPNDIANVCGRCHNKRIGLFPYVPQKAKAVLLLLRESKALFDADRKLYRPAKGSMKAFHMQNARSSLYSAKLDWHKFDLDSITGHLEDMFNSLKKLSRNKRPTSYK
ncbi:hypothetical protein BMS3Abin07_01194 [bacterium BMS3Abin07]|nr:hypothetical protein BMS3Abin07_01194 [bacterium BMS3Abin07]GBE31518.1 hypothetical protein BMS3Bbin05_00419 [bacterium BMS3Bbin05]